MVRESKVTYHDQGSDNPVDHNAESDLHPNFSLTEDAVKSFVSDFTQDRVHHNEQSDGFE